MINQKVSVSKDGTGCMWRTYHNYLGFLVNEDSSQVLFICLRLCYYHHHHHHDHDQKRGLGVLPVP